MYLIGDIGNTDVKICLLDSRKKVKKRLILKTKLISKNYLYKKFKNLKIYKHKIKIILFCSVVPNVYKIIKFYLKKKLNANCYELKDINLKKLINTKVNRKQIGSDRLANAISIVDRKKNFIVLDFGTATTFDVIVKNNYLGGIIAPGVKLSLDTLVSKASLIHPLNLSKIKNVLGKNTSDAVKSGFYWGYIGLINNLIKLIKKETHKSFKIMLTGGLSHLFKKSIYCNSVIDKDLTIKGLIKVIKKIK